MSSKMTKILICKNCKCYYALPIVIPGKCDMCGEGFTIVEGHIDEIKEYIKTNNLECKI